MSAGEFQLIERYFTALGAARADVLLGVGDDAALLAAPPGCCFAVASYSVGVGAAPETLARECFDRAALALQAAGAAPAWLTMALSLERVHEPWIERFCAALHERCVAAGVCVVGGDTTAGADAVTIFLTGIVQVPLPRDFDGFSVTGSVQMQGARAKDWPSQFERAQRGRCARPVAPAGSPPAAPLRRCSRLTGLGHAGATAPCTDAAGGL